MVPHGLPLPHTENVRSDHLGATYSIAPMINDYCYALAAMRPTPCSCRNAIAIGIEFDRSAGGIGGLNAAGRRRRRAAHGRRPRAGAAAAPAITDAQGS